MSEDRDLHSHARVRRGRLPNGEARSHVLRVKVSREERDELHQRAVELTAGNISKLLVSAALSIQIQDADRRASKEDIDRLTQMLFHYFRQIAAIGNNVNQIAKAVNAGDRYDMQLMRGELVKLTALTNEVRDVIVRERKRGMFQ